VGNTVKTKLSKTEATNIYVAKSSLKSLAYKDQLTVDDLTEDTLTALKGESGPPGNSITNATVDANGHLILTIG
jgi:hypothetical protein